MWHAAWHVGCKQGPCSLLNRTPHMVWCEVGIPLGLLNGLMAKQLPYSKKVYTIHHGMGSKGVPEGVKGHSLQSYVLNNPAYGVNEPIEIPAREPFTDWCWASLEHGHNI